MKLNDQVAIVTGASRGIGRGVALRLAQEGCKVVGISRALQSCESVAQEMKAQGRVFQPYGVDICDEKGVESVVEQVMEKFGRIDILINNAGITRDTLLMRMSSDDWDAVLQTNLKGAFHWTKFVSKHMMKARYGRIVNISSIIGLRGNAGQANYAAAKAGLIGFGKSVAREFASRNIICNTVCPGFIETDMTAGLNEELKKRILEEIPLKRMGTTEDIAHAVTFLCLPEASYITGQILTVDGGLVM